MDRIITMEDRIRGRVSARFADSPYDQPYEHEGGGGSGGGGDTNEGYDLFEPFVDQHAHEAQAASSNLSQAGPQEGDGYNGYVDMEDDTYYVVVKAPALEAQ